MNLSDFQEVFVLIEQTHIEAYNCAKECLPDVLKEFFAKHVGMKKIRFVGYTPSFNDGDPCNHYSDFGVGLYSHQQTTYRDSGFYIDSDDYSEDCEFFDLELDEDEKIVSFANDGFKGDVEAMYQDMRTIGQIVELLYTTNYEVLVTLEDDGTVEVARDRYNCGY